MPKAIHSYNIPECYMREPRLRLRLRHLHCSDIYSRLETRWPPAFALTLMIVYDRNRKLKDSASGYVSGIVMVMVNNYRIPNTSVVNTLEKCLAEAGLASLKMSSANPNRCSVPAARVSQRIRSRQIGALRHHWAHLALGALLPTRPKRLRARLRCCRCPPSVLLLRHGRTTPTAECLSAPRRKPIRLCAHATTHPRTREMNVCYTVVLQYNVTSR